MAHGSAVAVAQHSPTPCTARSNTRSAFCLFIPPRSLGACLYFGAYSLPTGIRGSEFSVLPPLTVVTVGAAVAEVGVTYNIEGHTVKFSIFTFWLFCHFTRDGELAHTC